MLELLRNGRIGADFSEWRVGAPFKFRGQDDAEERPPQTAAAASDRGDAAAAVDDEAADRDSRPPSETQSANGQPEDGVARDAGEADAAEGLSQPAPAAEIAVMSLTLIMLSLRSQCCSCDFGLPALALCSTACPHPWHGLKGHADIFNVFKVAAIS